MGMCPKNFNKGSVNKISVVEESINIILLKGERVHIGENRCNTPVNQRQQVLITKKQIPNYYNLTV